MPNGSKLLGSFREIVIKDPVDMIIEQVRGLITSGELAPGDRLPAERKLAEKLGVSRGQIREAISKLEFYGILKTLPQSGTVVAGLGITALEGLITDVLQLEDSDFASLVETRVILETHGARLAAQRRTDADLARLDELLEAYQKAIHVKEAAVEEDLMFHVAIAEASKNVVLKSLMLIITPDIVKSFRELDICKDDRSQRAYEEHCLILDHIRQQEPEKAAQAMQLHLREVLDYSYTLRNHS